MHQLDQVVVVSTFVLLAFVLALVALARTRTARTKQRDPSNDHESAPLLTAQKAASKMVVLAPTADLNKFLPKANPHHLPTHSAPARSIVAPLSDSLAASAHLDEGAAALPADRPAPRPQRKRIAIVGAGTAGIGALIGLKNVPEEVRAGWEIDLFERREDVGGVWFPDYEPPVAPKVGRG